MKNIVQNGLKTSCILLTMVALASGCASHAPAPTHLRGWIGGEYLAARTNCSSATVFFSPTRYAATRFRAATNGIILDKLGTNTPAGAAGLRAGDVIVEMNGQPVPSLQEFHKKIDASVPGSSLPMTVFRDGKLMDFAVTVGRESYHRFGTLAVAFPPIVRGWQLFPDPGFSVVFAGWDTGSRVRKDMKGRDAHERDWRVWLVLVELSKTKTIFAEEIVPPTTTPSMKPVAMR